MFGVQGFSFWGLGLLPEVMEWNGARESAWFRFSSNEIATAGAPGISSLREEAVPFRAQFKGSGLRV